MKSVANTLDPLNLVHKGGSVLSNVFTPWKSGSSGTGDSGVPLPTVPTTAQPVGATDPSVINAQDQYAQANNKKNSFNKTIFAGDDGGFMGKRFTGQGVAGRNT